MSILQHNYIVNYGWWRQKS